MTDIEKVQDVDGFQKVVEWFGSWPSFHDAEVVSLELNRAGASILKIHAFRMTSALDATGHFATEKHAIVTFYFAEILSIELADFNHQNVLSGLDLIAAEGVYSVELWPSYGLSGKIVTSAMSLQGEPGIPKGSVYKGIGGL